jgi:hypothetical protein
MADEIITCRQSDLNQMVKEQRTEAVQDALSPFKSKQQTGYFSTVRFRFIRSGAGPAFTYTCSAATPRVAFSYPQNGIMDSAGFVPGTQSNLRFTNLSDANKTRDGETYYIAGIALYRGATSDALLSALVWDTAAMTLVMNTDNLWSLGCLHFFPSTSGLSGRGFTRIQVPPLDSETTDLQLLQNSVEDAGAFFSFTNPLIWKPSGQTDSSLAMQFTFNTDIVVTTVARAAGAGVAAYDPPATDQVGTFVDVTVRLIGHSVRDLSLNK